VTVSAWARVFQAFYLAFVLALFAGIALLFLERRVGVFVMLAGFIGYVGMHLLLGIGSYRETMRRPWPKVPPIEDDDDEW
jgi:hypothetical protein